MIILITGAGHTGKTALAQSLLEQHHFPYLSIDHLKMGLIRSKNTELTPLSDIDELTAYLWPIVREMIKTAIENRQNLIVEGCYVPLNWQQDFGDGYREHIRCICLVMSERYIRSHWEDICAHANDIECRLDDDIDIPSLIEENERYRRLCEQYGVAYTLIDKDYTDIHKSC